MVQAVDDYYHSAMGAPDGWSPPCEDGVMGAAPIFACEQVRWQKRS